MVNIIFSSRKFRIITAVVLVSVIVGVAVEVGAIEFSQQYLQSQEVEQQTVSILKQYSLYDPNYSYVIFGSGDLNKLGNAGEFSYADALMAYALIKKDTSVEFDYKTGPLCANNSPPYHCEQFVLMVLAGNLTYAYSVIHFSSYRTFYEQAYDWHFYLFYATYALP